jgi:hypothetical protein
MADRRRNLPTYLEPDGLTDGGWRRADGGPHDQTLNSIYDNPHPSDHAELVLTTTIIFFLLVARPEKFF